MGERGRENPEESEEIIMRKDTVFKWLVTKPDGRWDISLVEVYPVTRKQSKGKPPIVEYHRMWYGDIISPKRLKDWEDLTPEQVASVYRDYRDGRIEDIKWYAQKEIAYGVEDIKALRAEEKEAIKKIREVCAKAIEKILAGEPATPPSF